MSSMEEFIASQLHQALDQQEHAEFSTPTAERGLAIGGPHEPYLVLTVEDVARIASAAVAAFRFGVSIGRPESR